jgi:hypothetical protein
MKSTLKCLAAVLFLAVSLCYAQNGVIFKTVSEMNNMPGENYLPLSKGNTFRIAYHAYDPDPFYQRNIYRLYTIIINDTVRTNNKLYYKVNDDGAVYYLREDRVNNKIYRTETLSPINEILYFDFTLANNAPYLQGNNIVTAYNSGFIRGFKQSNGNYLHVSKNTGFYEIYGRFGSYNVYTYFIESYVKINDTSYLVRSPEFAPVFRADSIPEIINSNYWHIQFSYSCQAIVGLQLLDSVSIYSYYIKGNDSILSPRIGFSHSYIDTTIVLDSSLLAQNYKFCYRFEYKDNFIEPSRYYYPASGYNSLNYVSGVKEEAHREMGYVLEQNYPNPFNPSTTIKYYIPTESKVNITIYNALGSRIKELYDGTRQQGNYEAKFDGAGLSSGVYFVTIKSVSVDGKKSFIDSKKMVLMK